ncbi:MAG: hypothetical protein HQL88_09395 [Magnetococcales bacterium]|nr:hypothetical protein [Magnetococcales bacterium]
MQITESLLAVGELEAPALVKGLVAQGGALPAVSITAVTGKGVVGQTMSTVGQAMNSLAMGGGGGGAAVAVKAGGGASTGLGVSLGVGAWAHVLLIGVVIALGVGVCNYLYRNGAAGGQVDAGGMPEG